MKTFCFCRGCLCRRVSAFASQMSRLFDMAVGGGGKGIMTRDVCLKKASDNIGWVFSHSFFPASVLRCQKSGCVSPRSCRGRCEVYWQLVHTSFPANSRPLCLGVSDFPGLGSVFVVLAVLGAANAQCTRMAGGQKYQAKKKVEAGAGQRVKRQERPGRPSKTFCTEEGLGQFGGQADKPR